MNGEVLRELNFLLKLYPASSKGHYRLIESPVPKHWDEAFYFKLFPTCLFLADLPELSAHW